MLQRNTPGMTRSSEPTDQRRRNTTIPGIVDTAYFTITEQAEDRNPKIPQKTQ